MVNILSLFDGMSCGQIALNKINFKYDNYYASEIDDKTILITQINYPNTIQLGDITKIKDSDLPQIYLMMGGSPCQGFSTAGKNLNFNDPRSKLFFEFVRLLEEIKPKYFLLENVKMKKEHRDIISNYLGVEPIEINSSLVSAQDRKRLYWTNIPNITQPRDKKIYLKDILEKTPNDNLYLSEKVSDRYYSSPTKIVNTKSCVIGKLSEYQGDRIFDINCKASSLSANGGNNAGGSCNIVFDPITNNLRRLSPIECERLQNVPDNYTDGISITQRYKMLGNGWTVDVISHMLKNMK